MASPEDLRDLKRKNKDLAKKLQYWKILASQREDEKLDLMKEFNELRLKLSRLRSSGSVQASNFDAALQSAAQKSLAHLVRASGEIATTMDLAKAYMRDREELYNASPRWSSIGGTPSTSKKDKVHRVPPLMIGGQSIQPVVALTMLDTSNALSAARNYNPNRNVTERAVPMRMLQDVYIPLTRIDIDLQTQNMEIEDANNADDSAGVLELDDDEEGAIEDSQRMDEDEDSELISTLNAVAEDTEPENNEETPPRTRAGSNRTDNPLEGPSWMLNASNENQPSASKFRTNLEPDSTTELDEVRNSPPTADKRNKTEDTAQLLVPPSRTSREFSPTVRRRKRTSSPPAAASPLRTSQYSPRPAPPRRISNSGRVLKVLVAKMRLDAEGDTGAAPGTEGSPPKRAATSAALAASHAPSPNGATVTGVIVSESSQDNVESLASGEPTPHHSHLHQHQHPLNTSDNIDGCTDDTHEYTINIDIQTKTREHNEQTNNRDNNDQTNVEKNQINVGRRTNSRGQTEQTNSKERRNKQTNEENVEEHRVNFERRTDRRERKKQNGEHTREIQPSDSMEQNERTDSRERNKLTDKEHITIKIESGEQNMDSQQGNSAERSDRQTNSSERCNPGRRSNERQEEVRTDSRASNDASRQDDTRAANVFRRRAGSCDSDSGSGGEREGRTRRTRRAVTYKEKPLNRKMRQ